MRRKRWYVALLLCWASLLSARELTLAVEPFLTPRSLVAAFQPLRDAISEQSGHQVVLVTARNYDEYLARLLRGGYDFAIIGSHSALLAVERAGYIPLLKAAGGLKAILLVKQGAAIKQMSDLNGQSIAFPNALTMTAMLGRDMFRQAGMIDGRDVTFRYNEFQNSAAMALLRGDVSAALISDLALLPMTAEIKQSVTVLSESSVVPSLVLLAHHQIPALERDRVTQAVVRFTMNTPPEQNFLVRIGINFNRPFTDQDKKVLQPYVEALKRRQGIQ
ncbi:phosphate/phosphite/phosphonate ABC transporter substrate-binding protein [Chitinivorax sp. B]|uniref:phosphate/phosphite/phosphonate ABC transporter substrate-binding protein n=1 Tax=Chitinivorax sp. B TaxID=2502235 RepID=UPI001485A40D|nr:phosphate/phosphite/phosphonate ABC transporter substrate-binding protein [Chitinivorax sp. B]